jgi:hypothetical protein
LTLLALALALTLGLALTLALLTLLLGPGLRYRLLRLAQLRRGLTGGLGLRGGLSGLRDGLGGLLKGLLRSGIVPLAQRLSRLLKLLGGLRIGALQLLSGLLQLIRQGLSLRLRQL